MENLIIFFDIYKKIYGLGFLILFFYIDYVYNIGKYDYSNNSFDCFGNFGLGIL